MELTFEPLGKYVRLVDERNTNMVTESVLGINIDKYFMPSVANVIGTDLGNYKLLRKGRFACNPMHVGRDGRLPVARYTEEVPAIVSPAYFMFEIIDKTEIEPEYLMLCFRRPDFDRMCWFRTDASVRGGITWEDVCALTIPVPPLPEQQKIVRDYQVISERIALLRKMNAILQDVIDADFEKFYDEKCDTETLLSNICSLTSSKRVFAEDYVSEGIPFYRGGEISLKKNGEPIDAPLYISQEHYNKIKATYGIPVEGDILITAVGTIGNSYLVEKEEFYFKDGNIIWMKEFIEPEYRFFVYDFLQSSMFRDILNSLYIGSTQIALTIVGLSGMKINIPDVPILKNYAKRSAALRKQIQRNQRELLKLHDLRKLLLTKGA